MNPDHTPLVVAAAQAAAAAIPAVVPLEAADPQPGNEHVTAAFKLAVVAAVNNGGTVSVLVGEDLAGALAGSPLGGLDAAAAVQPAIDAATAALGLGAEQARIVELEDLVDAMGGEFAAVPLIGDSIDAAFLISDSALDAGPTGAGAAQAGLGEAGPAASAGGGLGDYNSAQGHPDQHPISLPQVSNNPAAPVVTPFATRGLEMLHGVDMELTVELGRARMSVRDLLTLSPGDVLELDRAAGSPADLLVNGRLIARGEVVVVDEDFGLRLTEILETAG